MCVYIYEQIQEPITMSNSLLRGIYTLKHIPGVDNPADVMTKALPRGTFLKVVDLIYSFKNRVSVPAVVDCR